jgi:hypothetical protein
MILFTCKTSTKDATDTPTSPLKKLLLAKEWAEIVDYIRKNPDKPSSSLELHQGAKAKPLHVACALKVSYLLQIHVNLLSF